MNKELKAGDYIRHRNKSLLVVSISRKWNRAKVLVIGTGGAKSQQEVMPLNLLQSVRDKKPLR